MRRTLVIAAAALALAACSKPDKPADQPAAATPAPTPPPPAPLTNADLAGTWDATGMPMNKDSVVVTLTMTNTPTGEGSFVTVGGQKVPATRRVLDADSIVTESAGFKSAVRRGMNVSSTRTVLRLRDGKLVGVISAKYANGDTASYRLTGTKKAP
jgi:hypothetical protein